MTVIDPAHEARMFAICERFLGAIVRGDIEEVRTIYAPDCVIWHNNADATETVDENMRTIEAVPKIVRGFRYEDVVRRATADGFIEQHVVRGTTPSGEELRIPAVLICTVANGRITRLDEYLDSAHLAPLMPPT